MKRVTISLSRSVGTGWLGSAANSTAARHMACRWSNGQRRLPRASSPSRTRCQWSDSETGTSPNSPLATCGATFVLQPLNSHTAMTNRRSKGLSNTQVSQAAASGSIALTWAGKGLFDASLKPSGRGETTDAALPRAIPSAGRLRLRPLDRPHSPGSTAQAGLPFVGPKRVCSRLKLMPRGRFVKVESCPGGGTKATASSTTSDMASGTRRRRSPC